MAARRLSCGLDFCCVADLNSCLNNSSSSGYDFVVCPIIHPRFRRELVSGKAKSRPGPLTRPDLVLTGKDWSCLVVAKMSPYLDVDSNIESVRQSSEKALEQELLFASHLGVPAIMLPPLTGKQPFLARSICSRVKTSAYYQASYQIWVRVPMQAPQQVSKQWLNKDDPSEEGDSNDNMTDAEEDFGEDTWEWWNYFRSICSSHRKIGVALELSLNLPSEAVIQRWFGEPVRCLIIPTSVFLTNRKGFPVLSKAHQSVIQRFYVQDTQIVISGAVRHSHVKYYQQYLEYLWQNQPPEDPITHFARGYEDYLQSPLQPLLENLESQTYEIFERDPVKYTEYQKAMHQAILDKVDEKDKDTKVLVLMVVGAGRGPLVRAALNAAKATKRKIKVYAVEKNPNAIVTLESAKAEDWGDKVTIVSCDMRLWDPPEKADILVSELLGSFGDNELSPECLDGAQKCLKDDGISIPSSYTSYLSPIQSPKLYCEVQGWKESSKDHRNPFETLYVVRLHNKVELAPPKPVFTFNHPNRSEAIDNSGYVKLNYPIQTESVLHGFAGYFDTVLYKDITLSIVPDTHSDGMFSWFPMYFPIRSPIYLPKGSEVEVHFWRRVSPRNVWYEWCITSPQITMIHNLNGHSYTIGL